MRKQRTNCNRRQAIMKLNFALTVFSSSAAAVTCQRLLFLIENDSSPGAGRHVAAFYCRVDYVPAIFHMLPGEMQQILLI